MGNTNNKEENKQNKLRNFTFKSLTKKKNAMFGASKYTKNEEKQEKEENANVAIQNKESNNDGDITNQAQSEIKSEKSNQQKRCKNERLCWIVGSKCLIYSNSANKWVNGTIIKIHNDKDGEWLTVRYITNATKTKQIQRDHANIKPIDNVIIKSEKTELKDENNQSISNTNDDNSDENDTKNNFIQKGTEIIKLAVQKDSAEEYESAIHLYNQGIQYWMTGLQYEKNKRIESAIKEKVQTFLIRVEEIKKCIQEPPVEPPGPKIKVRFDCSDSDDEDTVKMQGALASAIVMENPNIKWDDVSGLETAKQLLKEAVILPIKFPQLFQGNRKPWPSILLYGPPGSGKTYLAKAVATEAGNSTFFSVSSSDLVSKYVGEKEKLVKNLFQMARDRKPSIIFIDQVDSLASGILTLSVAKDTCGVLTLGATNCPWDLKPAILRRFVKRIYIALPGKEAREHMFRIHIGKTPNSLTNQDFALLAERTDGFSGGDISVLVQHALMQPVTDMSCATHFIKHQDPENKCPYIWIPCSPATPNAVRMSLLKIPEHEQNYVRAENLKLSHFLRALFDTKPSVSKLDIKRYNDWTAKFG
eukprot:135170_1